ncbi:MAG: histidine phosphatase family protein [Gammaproteobacteria bacterium]
MARIYLVRHGRAAAGFADHPDPGLEDTGRRQAEAAAEALAPLGPLALRSSPLARALETAAPLAARWGREPQVEERVAEIPSPTEDLAVRAQWLRKVMAGNWADVPELADWRARLVSYLEQLGEDSVIFSHFIAINVAVGAATGDDRVVCFRPDNGSITVIENEGRSLSIVELGSQADTRVN